MNDQALAHVAEQIKALSKLIETSVEAYPADSLYGVMLEYSSNLNDAFRVLNEKHSVLETYQKQLGRQLAAMCKLQDENNELKDRVFGLEKDLDAAEAQAQHAMQGYAALESAYLKLQAKRQEESA